MQNASGTTSLSTSSAALKLAPIQGGSGDHPSLPVLKRSTSQQGLKSKSEEFSMGLPDVPLDGASLLKSSSRQAASAILKDESAMLGSASELCLRTENEPSDHAPSVGVQNSRSGSIDDVSARAMQHDRPSLPSIRDLTSHFGKRKNLEGSSEALRWIG
jgi:hypothetical protein